MKSINDFFGNAYIVAGALKSILIILAILQLISVLLGGAFVNDYAAFTTILSFIELALIPISIVMIIVNSLKANESAKGYWLGLIAIAIEFIFPSFVLFFLVFFNVFCF